MDDYEGMSACEFAAREDYEIDKTVEHSERAWQEYEEYLESMSDDDAAEIIVHPKPRKRAIRCCECAFYSYNVVAGSGVKMCATINNPDYSCLYGVSAAEVARLEGGTL